MPVLQKVGVVGVGAVGQECAFALVLRGSCRELVLVDRTAERATAVATDMRYGAPLSSPVDIVAGDLGGPRGRRRGADMRRGQREGRRRDRP